MKSSTRVTFSEAAPRAYPELWTLMSKTKRGSFCFGGDFPVSPVEVEGLTSAPELFTNYQRLISRDGMWKGTQYLGGRSITLSMNILVSRDEDINTVVTELAWAFPIGYGTNQEEIELHFNIPGIANGAQAYIKGMVQKRDIKLDAAYANTGAARIDVQLYCANPTMKGYGVAQARMDTAAGFFNGGALAEFEFGADGLDIPSDWFPGVEQKVLVTNTAKDTDDTGNNVGPKWRAEIFGPVVAPSLMRRNYFGDVWSIDFKAGHKDFFLAEGQSLVYEQVKGDLPSAENPRPASAISHKVYFHSGTGEPRDITDQVVTSKGENAQADTTGEAWRDVGLLRTGDQIATSEYWSIKASPSKTAVRGNSYGFVTWWGGDFI
ncbi:hypothetical protein ACFYYS_06210 [Streptomyces sp. NPDC002120]|uniref:hypothetical protein n=1 Tax=Streptomyces sp. NPDC002120 TaxID=3364631 RepID=UPI0036B10553